MLPYSTLGQPVEFTGPFTFTTKSNVALELCLGGTTILHYIIRLMVLYLHRRVRLHVHWEMYELYKRHLPLVDLKLHHQEAKLSSGMVFVSHHMLQYIAANKFSWSANLIGPNRFQNCDCTYQKSIRGSSTYYNIICRQRILREHLHSQINLITQRSTAQYKSSKHTEWQEIEQTMEESAPQRNTRIRNCGRP